MKISLPQKIRTPLSKLILITLLVKTVVVLFIVVGYYVLPFCEACRTYNFLIDREVPQSLTNAFTTWDAQHYAYLANNGYAPDQMSNAFYPLFPVLMSGSRYFGFSSVFLSGFVLANMLSLIAIVFFYVFVQRLKDERTAFIASLFLLSFPTSFYLHLIYSESLFLLLVVVGFLALYQKKMIPVVATGLLLPFTRPQGILVVVPFLFYYLQPFLLAIWGWMTERKKTIATQFAQTSPAFFILVSFVFGFFLYLLFMKITTGSFVAGFAAQDFFKSDSSIGNLFRPIKWLTTNYITVDWDIHGVHSSTFNRIFFLLFAISLPLIYKHVDTTLFVYALVIGLIPALSGDLNAFPRYILVVFPLFIALAVRYQKHYWYWLTPMAILQFILLMLHTHNHWVA